MPNVSEEREQVSHGLNLWLPLADKNRMGELLLGLLAQQPAISAALRDLHYVHFARFLPTPDGSALQVITSFDGDFDAYVLDFVLAIGDQFEFIMGFVAGRPAQSVKDDPAGFLDFIRKAEQGSEPFSAYPQHTVIDILGAAGVAPAAVPAAPVTVDRSDVQANVLRGVAARHALHLPLRFADAAGARALLAELLDGSTDDAQSPTITSDATRPAGDPRPPYWLTVGLSHAGLSALGLAAADRARFELAFPAFGRGPHHAASASAHGDVGDSLPARWQLGGKRYPLDMMLTLHADDTAELAAREAALLARCTAHGVTLIGRRWAAQAMAAAGQPGRYGLHFGYVDGLSQPRLAITGEPPPSAADEDDQPLAGVGEFLLGSAYPNVYGGRDSLGGLSPELAQNASFAAVRVLEQDVAAFEDLLDRVSAEHQVDREWVAAKLMGRWRDGTPSSQSPDVALPEAGAPPRNRFDYAPAEDRRATPDDAAGLRCPIGAHARRMNPRSARVAGRPHSRRLLRRGLPYGPAFVRGAADAGAERGLFGVFLCADLDRQFEFLLRQWAQGDRATTGIVGEQDPIIGAQTAIKPGQPMTGRFRIARAAPAHDIVFELPRLTKTVGSVYLLMPGMAALRRLAQAPLAPPANEFSLPAARLRTVDPARLIQVLRADAETGLEAAVARATPAFDPRDETFRDDPYPVYAAFRQSQPVAYIPDPIDSVWVFSHDAVKAVTDDLQRFHKRPSSQANSPCGLLFMDPDPHTKCRAAIQPMFNDVLALVQPGIAAAVQQQYLTQCRNRGQAKPIDWLAAFARPVARQGFFEMLGLDLSKPEAFIKDIELALATVTPAHDPAADDLLAKQMLSLATQLGLSMFKCKPGRLFAKILQTTEVFDADAHQWTKGLPPLLVEQLAITVTIALPSFLPLQWFIALATWRLLENDGVLLQQLKDDPAISNRQVVDELLRYDTSIPMAHRHVVADGTMLGGLTLNKDARITLAWASASRDETAFGPDADRINLQRGKGPGWAFGAGNEHHCLGAPLVYAVMAPVIQVLRDADPLPRLAQGFTPLWGDGAMFRPMVDLMVHC